MLSIEGEVFSGVRLAVFSEGHVEKIVPNFSSRQVLMSWLNSVSAGRKGLTLVYNPRGRGVMCVQGDQLLGTSGDKKLFLDLDHGRGALVFGSLVKLNKRRTSKIVGPERFERNFKVASHLSRIGLGPRVFNRTQVNLRARVKVLVPKQGPGKVKYTRIQVGGVAQAIVSERVNCPEFRFNLASARQTRMFKRAFSKKHPAPFELLDHEKNLLYGNGFAARHPNFTSKGYDAFYAKICQICKSDSLLAENRDSKDKNPAPFYGNQLYDTIRREWLLVDFE